MAWQNKTYSLWHPEKAKRNLKKHGVGFKEASTVFRDPFAQVMYDPDHSDDEHRQIIIGYSNKNRILFVSFHERADGVIRLISARKADSEERRAYEEKTR